MKPQFVIKLINHFWGKNIFQVFKHGFQLVFREWFPVGAASNRQMPEAAEALRGQNLVGSQGRKKVALLTLSWTSSAEKFIVYSYLVGGFKHFLFSNIWDVVLHIDELIFFEMVKTTNQPLSIVND